MTNLTQIKTTDEGLVIYVNAETGQFVAVVGECHCDGKPRLEHGRYCRAKTISRKSMADLERELAKQAGPRAVIKALDVEGYSSTGPRVVEVSAVVVQRGDIRYRNAAGELTSSYHSLYVYDEQTLQALQEVWAEYQAADQKWKDARAQLTRLGRENFAEVRRQQQAAEAQAQAAWREAN